MAQLLGVSTLLLVLVASAPQPDQPLLRTTTRRSLDAFGACFANARDKAGSAWAFMPIGRGGTFTDAGANGSAAAYWLQVAWGAQRGDIRLFGDEGAQPPASLIEAINQCR